MITEDYVSFETAKLLKEKGFKQYTQLVYDEHGNFMPEGVYNDLGGTYKAFIPCPTLQMAMKWLREIHNIHINLDVGWLCFANALGWMYTITNILENGVDYVCSKGDENDKTFYSSYEQACEAAIKYCLENLI